MIHFSTTNLMDEQKCYDYLVEILHPNGLCCPNCHRPVEECHIHRSDRTPILNYACSCSRIFNAFAGSVWQGTHHKCCVIVQILKGVAQGTSTLHMAQELGINYKRLLERRHKLQKFAEEACNRETLNDEVVEVDEMYQNSGEKGMLHPNPNDPPRQRANKQRGHGTWNTDRPPVQGIIGRESGQVHITVKKNSARDDLEPDVLQATKPDSTINSDEWSSYNHIADSQRKHVTVNHSNHEWARDDDGDGIREVHNNTIEGFWTGVRNFLRPFRGVNKIYLQQYLAIHEWAHNLKSITMEYLRILCGVTQMDT